MFSLKQLSADQLVARMDVSAFVLKLFVLVFAPLISELLCICGVTSDSDDVKLTISSKVAADAFDYSNFLFHLLGVSF